MTTLALRFRDLNIPDGETIRRHREKIESRGHVWWGWIMRQRETFPAEFLSGWGRRLDEESGCKVLLFNSGEGRLYSALMRGVAAYPEGMRVQTPEVQKTPSYMAEAECPAWFQLSEISPEPLNDVVVTIVDFPTLPEPAQVDLALKDKPLTDPDELRLSTATLWVVDMQPMPKNGG